MNKSFPVTRSSLPPYEEYCEEIRDIWDSRWLTNMGVKHGKLQKQLEEMLQVRHVVLFTNGHLALESALAAMDLPAGSEVITTPFTFISTTHAVYRNGLKPVFCDIRDTDFTMDPEKIEPLITEKTSAIVPVHVYGNICDTEAIQKIADRYHLKVVYDAAHAFGESKGGRSVADFGDASMFSFHATKVFNTIEGGAVCCSDDSVRQRLDDLRNFGIRGYEEIAGPGGNAKMNEFQAAMGLCNLKHLDGEIARRKDAAERYRERLSGREGIFLCPEDRDQTYNYGYMPVLLDGGRFRRDKVFEKLAEDSIFPRKYFYPLTSSVSCYAGCTGAGSTPVAEHVANNVLTLPLYAELTPDDADHICDCLLRLGD